MILEELDIKAIEHLSEAVNAEDNPTKFLGIDPGSRNGICGYDCKHYLQFMYTVMEPDILKFLDIFNNVDLVVIEDYVLYPNKATEQIYSDMMTPRVIGRVEGWAARKGAQLIKQGASIKDTGYKWIGKNPPAKGKSGKRDEMDAHVHFMYWAIKSGRINAVDLLQRDE